MLCDFSRILSRFCIWGHFVPANNTTQFHKCSSKCVFVPLSANSYIGNHQLTGRLVDSASPESCRQVKEFLTRLLQTLSQMKLNQLNEYSKFHHQRFSCANLTDDENLAKLIERAAYIFALSWK
jgi:hypothetical protein